MERYQLQRNWGVLVNGVDLKVIQEQLGNSSLAVTERYFSVDPLEAQRAVEQLRF